LQELSKYYPHISFRAFVHPSVPALHVEPASWARFEIKPWIPEDECPLPPNETLYILEQ
jgi:hypothetical protein